MNVLFRIGQRSVGWWIMTWVGHGRNQEGLDPQKIWAVLSLRFTADHPRYAPEVRLLDIHLHLSLLYSTLPYLILSLIYLSYLISTLLLSNHYWLPYPGFTLSFHTLISTQLLVCISWVPVVWGGLIKLTLHVQSYL